MPNDPTVPQGTPKRRIPDQCAYPDRKGAPGDTCVWSATRKRETRYGWLWLCEEHFRRPERELFDRRCRDA